MILYYLCLILELSRAKSVLLYLVISVEIMSVNICRISILFTSVMNTQLSAVYIYKYQVKTISSTSLLTFNTISTSTFLVAKQLQQTPDPAVRHIFGRFYFHLESFQPCSGLEQLSEPALWWVAEACR